MHDIEKKYNLKEHTHPSICQLWIKHTECIYSANYKPHKCIFQNAREKN